LNNRNPMYRYTKSITAHDNFQLEYAQNLGEPLRNPQWERNKQHLIAEPRDDEFYLQVSLKTHQIIWHHQMNKWLGYDVKPPLQESFFDNIIHPFILPYYNAFALGMFELIRGLKGELSYNSMRYKVTVPMRNAKGEYICVQQISYPCELDAQGQVVTYWMRCIRNDSYIGQPLQPSIMMDTQLLKDWIVHWHQFAAQFMPIDDHKRYFTRDELKVLKEAYLIRFEEQRNKLLQQKLQLSIKHFNANIKFKVKEMFIHPLHSLPKPEPLGNFYTCLPKFNDVYQIAEFLYYSGLLDILTCQLRLP
jgi:hypothetical protein